MVMEASRAEYLKQQQQQLNFRESSTSGAEPSSSAASKPTILGIGLPGRPHTETLIGLLKPS